MVNDVMMQSLMVIIVVLILDFGVNMCHGSCIIGVFLFFDKVYSGFLGDTSIYFEYRQVFACFLIEHHCA